MQQRCSVPISVGRFSLNVPSDSPRDPRVETVTVATVGGVTLSVPPPLFVPGSLKARLYWPPSKRINAMRDIERSRFKFALLSRRLYAAYDREGAVWLCIGVGCRD